MKAQIVPHPCYEIYFANLDTLVQGEQAADAATIRATRDSFSAQRKESFIHEFAAEGFIDDDYRWFSFASSFPAHRVR